MSFYTPDTGYLHTFSSLHTQDTGYVNGAQVFKHHPTHIKVATQCPVLSSTFDNSSSYNLIETRAHRSNPKKSINFLLSAVVNNENY